MLGALVGAAAFLAPTWNAVVVGLRVAIVPDQLLGRVNSVARLISGGAMPLGSLGGGLLIEGIGTIRTLLVLAAVRLLLALAGTLSRGLRVDPRRLPSSSLKQGLADTERVLQP